MSNLAYGVGILDIHPVTKHKEFPIIEGKRQQILTWTCPYYKKWRSLLTRCYSKGANLVYKDCYVCDEWLTFSNFKSWMETQNWKGRQLDKDLVVRGNKLYSPATCVFITSRVNTFLAISVASSRKGNQPLGVYYHKRDKKFIAKCGDGSKGNSHICGYFDDSFVAHRSYQQRRLEIITNFITDETDERVIKGLTRIRNKLIYDIENKLETTTL